MTPQDFLTKALNSAHAGGHLWPEFAACEAALESAWGESKLCRLANNLFGQKQGHTTEGAETISIPTREYLHGQWVVVDAEWPKFPEWSASFSARMKLLRALNAYSPAVNAETGEDFVRAVSKVWATDPERGNKVLAIHAKHFKNGQIQ